MTRWLATALTLLVAGLVAPAPASAASARTNAGADKGWVTLFDGSSLDNWNQIGNADWVLVGGAVQADSGSGFLVSKSSYADFQIRAEFWVDSTANSGVFIRCADPTKVDAVNAYEVNIWDTRPDPTYGTGAIVNVAKVSAPMPKAGGKWNVYEITAKGGHFTIRLNGKQTVSGEDYKHAAGWIALQYASGNNSGSGTVKFRKVQIKPL
jgi:hypothetical protein